MDINKNQIDSLAPDQASIKAGKGLATLSKWQNIGFSEFALWGECQGSGSTPYKSQIDTRTFTFKCSCPSRKFPCKHGLGLMYLFVDNQSSFGNNMPTWVEEWIKSRDDRKQKQEEKKENPKTIDPEKKAKTEEKRFESINQGLDDLEIWLHDFIRRGFDSVKSESYSFFNQIASRMVDYKASGLSRRLKELSSLSSSGKEHDILLKKISKIYLLIKAFRNINNLPEKIQEDIKTQIGLTKTQDEILSLPSIKDNWFILGNLFEEEDNLKTKKTFLYGLETKKIAMVLDFSVAKRPFSNTDLMTGKVFSGEIIYYPSNLELRAIIKSKDFIEYKNNIEINSTIDHIYNLYSESLSKNPFIEKIPCFLSNINIHYTDKDEFILFEDKNFIYVNKSFKENFELILLTKSEKFNIFGEFNGKSFLPICIFQENRFNSFLGDSNL